METSTGKHGTWLFCPILPRRCRCPQQRRAGPSQESSMGEAGEYVSARWISRWLHCVLLQPPALPHPSSIYPRSEELFLTVDKGSCSLSAVKRFPLAAYPHNTVRPANGMEQLTPPSYQFDSRLFLFFLFLILFPVCRDGSMGGSITDCCPVSTAPCSQ